MGMQCERGGNHCGAWDEDAVPWGRLPLVEKKRGEHLVKQSTCRLSERDKRFMRTKKTFP